MMTDFDKQAFMDDLNRLNSELEVELQVLRTWLETACMLFVALDERGGFRYWNREWTRVLGWTTQDLKSMTIWEIIHEDDLEDTRRVWDKYIVGDEPVHPSLGFFTNRYRKKDGGDVTLTWYPMPKNRIGKLVVGAARYCQI